MKYIKINSAKIRLGERKIFSPKFETKVVKRKIAPPVKVSKLPRKLAKLYKEKEELKQQIKKHTKTSPVYKELIKKGVKGSHKKWREAELADKKLQSLIKKFKVANLNFNYELELNKV